MPKRGSFSSGTAATAVVPRKKQKNTQPTDDQGYEESNENTPMNQSTASQVLTKNLEVNNL